jgi:transcriptional regulator with XRE-family HTH domain
MSTNKGCPAMGEAFMTDLTNFGERVRSIRTEQDLTVKELSALCGVPEKTIYRIETGEVEDPRMSSVVPIIKALNCSADEVLFTKDEFPAFGKLRQLLISFGDMKDSQQEFILEVFQKLSFAMAMEDHISAKMVPVAEPEDS